MQKRIITTLLFILASVASVQSSFANTSNTYLCPEVDQLRGSSFTHTEKSDWGGFKVLGRIDTLKPPINWTLKVDGVTATSEEQAIMEANTALRNEPITKVWDEAGCTVTGKECMCMYGFQIPHDNKTYHYFLETIVN